VIRRQRIDELKRLMGRSVRIRSHRDPEEGTPARRWPVLVPTEEPWARLDAGWPARLTLESASAVTDLLIARLIDDVGALVWSLDHDFARMARIELARTFEG
jgi:hypothetical protein